MLAAINSKIQTSERAVYKSTMMGLFRIGMNPWPEMTARDAHALKRNSTRDLQLPNESNLCKQHFLQSSGG